MLAKQSLSRVKSSQGKPNQLGCTIGLPRIHIAQVAKPQHESFRMKLNTFPMSNTFYSLFKHSSCGNSSVATSSTGAPLMSHYASFTCTFACQLVDIIAYLPAAQSPRAMAAGQEHGQGGGGGKSWLGHKKVNP